MTRESRLPAAPDPHAEQDTGSGGSPRPSQATRLVRLAEAAYSFAVAPDGEPFALPRGGPLVAFAFRGTRSALRAMLADAYVAETGNAPSSSAVADALLALEGRARLGGEIKPALRVARHGAGFALDLGRADGLAAVVTPGGWSLGPTPIILRRTVLTAELREPVGGGSLAPLWSLAHVAEEARPLVLAWLLAALLDDRPAPILAFVGEAGAGKSVAARVLVQLIDPSPAPLRSAPRDLVDWCVSAPARALLCLTTSRGSSRGSRTPSAAAARAILSFVGACIRTPTFPWSRFAAPSR